MRHWSVCLGALGVAGCGLSTEVVPLARLEAGAAFAYMGRLALVPATGRWTDPCPVLPAETTATMNGVAARYVERGGINGNNPEAADACFTPAFRWDPYEPTTQVSTFELSDGSTTWTFTVWKPFEIREFVLGSHPDHQLRAGDTVIARTTVAEDGPLHTRGFVRGSRAGTVLFDLETPGDVVLDGPELRFVVPAVAAGELELWIESKPTVTVERCDAPLGCAVDGRAVSMLDAMIVP